MGGRGSGSGGGAGGGGGGASPETPAQAQAMIDSIDSRMDGLRTRIRYHIERGATSQATALQRRLRRLQQRKKALQALMKRLQKAGVPT